jgi:flagellar biogenesis protein FliO
MARIFGLALITLVGWCVRRLDGLRGVIRPRSGSHRLQIVEITPIHSKRPFVLAKRDETEHFLLLGMPQDLVVEAGIPSPPDIIPSPQPPKAAGSASSPRLTAVTYHQGTRHRHCGLLVARNGTKPVARFGWRRLGNWPHRSDPCAS